MHVVVVESLRCKKSTIEVGLPIYSMHTIERGSARLKNVERSSVEFRISPVLRTYDGHDDGIQQPPGEISGVLLVLLLDGEPRLQWCSAAAAAPRLSAVPSCAGLGPVRRAGLWRRRGQRNQRCVLAAERNRRLRTALSAWR